MAVTDDLLPLVKQNLIVTHDEDDELIKQFVENAISYSEGFQHKPPKFYGYIKNKNKMTGATRQAIIMLASHWYESRDGSTGGFFNNSAASADNVKNAVDRLLRMDKDVLV